MTSMLQTAKAELRAAGLFDANSDYNGDVGVQALALMETFCAYGHSGGSAECTLGVFSRLANRKPLTPLTGEDNEWDGSPGGLQQNNRCATVMRDGEYAWDTADHDKPVKFPYTPA